MSFSTIGANTPVVEVTNITIHGIWLLAHGQELFMAYTDFPWFKEQKVSAIFKVEELSPGHYYWPELDVDLTQEIIEPPEKFPNIVRGV